MQQSSKNIVLTYHAADSNGNNGLKGMTESAGGVYAHIGVITNKSNGSWAYAPSWGDNSAKYKLTYVSTDTWSLTIDDMRTYFGITDDSETIQKIALVFRSKDTYKEGKTASGGDIYVDVAEDGFELNLTYDADALPPAAAKPSYLLHTSSLLKATTQLKLQQTTAAKQLQNHLAWCTRMHLQLQPIPVANPKWAQ